MSNKYERSLGLRILGSFSAFALIFVLMYIVFAGFNLYSTLVLVSAITVIGGQAAFVGESVVECIVGFFEILLESLTTVFEVIGSIFNF